MYTGYGNHVAVAIPTLLLSITTMPFDNFTS